MFEVIYKRPGDFRRVVLTVSPNVRIWDESVEFRHVKDEVPFEVNVVSGALDIHLLQFVYEV